MSESSTKIRIYNPNVCKEWGIGTYYFEDVFELDQLVSGPWSRGMGHDEAYETLKESIRECGVKVPLQASFSLKDEALTITSGHRRYHAVKDLLKEEGAKPIRLPLVVTVYDGHIDSEVLSQTLTAVVSNLMRKDLTQVEKMRCFKLLADQGLSKKDIARALGKDRKTVERSLHLGAFDEPTLEYIEEKEQEGLLKARHVEIVGQKLNESLKKYGENDKEVEPEKLGQLRSAAKKVLEEHVRRREELKKPKSPELKEALKDLLEPDLLSKVVSIIAELDQRKGKASETALVTEAFQEVEPNIAL